MMDGPLMFRLGLTLFAVVMGLLLVKFSIIPMLQDWHYWMERGEWGKPWTGAALTVFAVAALANLLRVIWTI